MSVKIGSARIDENGKAKGGKAGDQTGKEVSTQNWYLHSKGWRVFRAKDAARAETIARQMQAACDNRHVGYDQGQRNTLYAQAQKVGFDISKVAVDCETDCSALVRVCCAAAGILDLPADFRTGNMPGNLSKTGAFTELTGDKYQKQSAYLRRGDILVTKTSGHTVVVLSDGPKVEKGVGRWVEITGGSVHVRSGPGLDAAVLGTVHRGDRLPYRGLTRPDTGRDWHGVTYNDRDAWVSSKYGRVVGA